MEQRNSSFQYQTSTAGPSQVDGQVELDAAVESDEPCEEKSSVLHGPALSPVSFKSQEVSTCGMIQQLVSPVSHSNFFSNPTTDSLCSPWPY